MQAILGEICGLVCGLLACILLLAASRRLLLAYAAVRLYRPAPPSDNAPDIWIICACRNEASRLPRLLEGLARLRYRGRYRVVLIDDSSDDETPRLMQEGRDRRPDLFEIALLTEGQAGKATALHSGLSEMPIADKDLMLVIDADHRLSANALDRLANYFADPNVAAVAIEHPVDAPDRSLVSAYCYLEAAVSELVTSRGQHALGLPTKLAGSWACRPAAFRQHYPTGWQMADDTVFTAGVAASGGRIPYAADVAALQDVPDSLNGYMSQHVRWSAGYAGSAAGALDRRRNTGVLATLDAWATHAGYFERPLMLVLFAAAAAGLLLGAPYGAAFALLVVLTYVTAIAVQIAAALRLSKASARLTLMSLAALPLLAADFAVSIRGAFLGLAGRRVAWTTDHRG